MGHQAIGEYLGGTLRMLDKVYHGVQSTITLKEGESKLFKNISSSFQAGRYHSWDVMPADTDGFEVVALADDGSTMAIENVEQNLYGIQFHPESILTPVGDVIIRNFLSLSKAIKQ